VDDDLTMHRAGRPRTDFPSIGNQPSDWFPIPRDDDFLTTLDFLNETREMGSCLMDIHFHFVALIELSSV
jgi:hypothetical protein